MAEHDPHPRKEPYVKPELVEYGGLTQITQAMSTGRHPDNNSTPGMNRSA